MTGPPVLRTLARWSASATALGELALVLCLASGTRVPPVVRAGVGLVTLAALAAMATLLAVDCRRHRRTGLGWRPAAVAAVADAVPTLVRRLVAHEARLFTSSLRWVTRRGPHGVRAGDTAVPYASGQAAVMYGLLSVSVVETALAYLIPWPLLHTITLAVDVWGVYLVIALHASCVVRPHVIGADGSLRLRYGVLLDIRVPAGHIAAVRVDRRFPESGLAAVDAHGAADLAVASQVTVTVELREPVVFVRPLGGSARARVFRFHADDPAAAVAALRARAALDAA
ncbi:hypothetical protein H8N00_03585 [Streptomyces sp. AC563]|uniref:hypothetical protein n=1 Tax=Streptomyces buecherae TaxID=2763006 RepID=UPI00164E6D66|nr:hypothetical protein [Streptomyces buecherae]MBC3988000.1 hypothetical protein [Streptomyces buecherae]